MSTSPPEAPSAPEPAPARMEDLPPAASAVLDAPLVLEALDKRWRADEPPVLDGLELVLDAGTLTWIGGENGVGKTTMLRIAAGLIAPDSGSVRVWGLTPQQNRARYQRLVAFLPAGDRGLYARLTVARQLEFCARIAMLDPARVAVAVAHALEAFDLVALAERRVDRMSMGQRQRLRLAMTFLVEPDVVLLDEPLTSLDSHGAELLLAAIAGVRERGGVVLWCSPLGDDPPVDFDARWLIETGRLRRA